MARLSTRGVATQQARQGLRYSFSSFRSAAIGIMGSLITLTFLVVLAAIWLAAAQVSAQSAATYPLSADGPGSVHTQQIAQAKPSQGNFPAGCGTWNVVSSPAQGNYLRGVSPVSADDVWAVGYRRIEIFSATLVEHWDGSTWSIVPSPNVAYSVLNGVAAVSTDDVWAVGDYYTTDTVDPTLVEHWDGSTWSVVSSPNVDGNGTLSGVAAASSSDVWAVGYYYNGTANQTLVEHWDGNVWSVVPSPNSGAGDNHLSGVAAVSSSDVWAVGSYNNGTANQTLVEHWDGSTWSVVSSPNVGTHSNDLYGIAATVGGEWWAVGAYTNDAGTSQTLILGPTGVMPSPNAGVGDNNLYGVAAVSATDVWAVGDYQGTPYPQTLVEHWNGSVWAVVPSPNASQYINNLYAVAAVTPGDLWAMGDYFTDLHPGDNLPLVERYVNACITPIPSPTSSLTATITPSPTSSLTATITPSPTSSPTVTTASSTTPISSPTPTSCSISFIDVPAGSPFYTFIHCLACLGIINGYADGTFKPNNNVTRGQLSKIVSNSAGFSDNQTTQMFQDVPVGSTFYQYIGRLASRGYISGYPCGAAGEPCVPPANLPYFRPNNNATRGQTSKIDANAAGFSDPPSGQQFEDIAVGTAFYTYTYRLVSRGVMGGYPCAGVGEPCVPPANLPYFRPNSNATRGQTSKIVANTFFPNCQTPAR